MSKKSKKQRKRYPEEFKKESVEFLLKSGKSVAYVADELGIESYNLSRWKSEYMNEKEIPTEPESEKDQIILRLKQENALLKQERDILKKAMGIVSKQ